MKRTHIQNFLGYKFRSDSSGAGVPRDDASDLGSSSGAVIPNEDPNEDFEDDAPSASINLNLGIN